jgi:hypothetical protein
VCPLLVNPPQPRVSHHISGKDSGEAVGRGHGWGRPPWVEESRLRYHNSREGTRRRLWVIRVEPLSLGKTDLDTNNMSGR